MNHQTVGTYLESCGEETHLVHSPPLPDRDLNGAKARKMKVFDGYGSKKRHSENKSRRRQSCTLTLSMPLRRRAANKLAHLRRC